MFNFKVVEFWVSVVFFVYIVGLYDDMEEKFVF